MSPQSYYIQQRRLAWRNAVAAALMARRAERLGERVRYEGLAVRALKRWCGWVALTG